MMKAEGISRGLTPGDVPVERQESAGKSNEDFSALLEARGPTAAQSFAFQETLPGPVCSSGCTDTSSIGAMDSGKAAFVYQKTAELYQSNQSEAVLAAAETGPSINLQKGGVAAFEADRTPAPPTNEASSSPESASGLSGLLSEIKGFFARLFSPQEPSAGKTEPVTQEASAETGSDNSVSGFFQWLGTVLSFGLWHADKGQQSVKASQDALTKASDEEGGAVVPESAALAGSRQNLPTQSGASTDLEVGRTAGSTALKIPAKIHEAIQEAARKYDLSADLITAVIKVESNFNPGAVSKEGAGGLMQLMPSTARALQIRNRFDIQENVDGGSRYLKSLMERFDGQVELALAAYNLGPDIVEKYAGVPPYRQTRHYIKKVLAYC